VAVIPDPDGPGRRRELERALAEARGGLGHTVAWREAPASARRAALALKIAPARGLAAARDHPLDLMLLGDPALSGDLVRARLGALDGLPPARRTRLLETLEAWLDAHGEARPAAERLNVHVQTVRYRLGRLRELLGSALDEPQGRLELALALRAVRLDADSAGQDGR